jgi:hypothetical protein
MQTQQTVTLFGTVSNSATSRIFKTAASTPPSEYHHLRVSSAERNDALYQSETIGSDGRCSGIHAATAVPVISVTGRHGLDAEKKRLSITWPAHR